LAKGRIAGPAILGLVRTGYLLSAGLGLWLWVVPLGRATISIPWDRWTGCHQSRAGQEPPLDHPFQFDLLARPTYFDIK
jgi:hypothetical protein